MLSLKTNPKTHGESRKKKSGKLSFTEQKFITGRSDHWCVPEKRRFILLEPGDLPVLEDAYSL